MAGGEVTDTRSGIVDLDGLSVTPNQFIYVMLSALIAAAFWLLFATKRVCPFGNHARHYWRRCW